MECAGADRSVGGHGDENEGGLQASDKMKAGREGGERGEGRGQGLVADLPVMTRYRTQGDGLQRRHLRTLINTRHADILMQLCSCSAAEVVLAAVGLGFKSGDTVRALLRGGSGSRCRVGGRSDKCDSGGKFTQSKTHRAFEAE